MISEKIKDALKEQCKPVAKSSYCGGTTNLYSYSFKMQSFSVVFTHKRQVALIHRIVAVVSSRRLHKISHRCVIYAF